MVRRPRTNRRGPHPPGARASHPLRTSAHGFSATDVWRQYHHGSQRRQQSSWLTKQQFYMQPTPMKALTGWPMTGFVAVRCSRRKTSTGLSLLQDYIARPSPAEPKGTRSAHIVSRRTIWQPPVLITRTRQSWAGSRDHRSSRSGPRLRNYCRAHFQRQLDSMRSAVISIVAGVDTPGASFYTFVPTVRGHMRLSSAPIGKRVAG
jgi:hypothetical protein